MYKEEHVGLLFNADLLFFLFLSRKKILAQLLLQQYNVKNTAIA